jgi:hypothetical protein
LRTVSCRRYKQLAARARRQAALDAKDGSNAGYNAGYDGSNAGYDGSNAGYGGEDDDYGYGEYDDLHPDVEEKLDSMAEKVVIAYRHAALVSSRMHVCVVCRACMPVFVHVHAF